ncbi:MAG: DUF6531 domain-containing protein, partial [Rhodocyclaceae bacterium]|nr:DUF6531 domain-containing protein [Rhodocyclaceae bacterium]
MSMNYRALHRLAVLVIGVLLQGIGITAEAASCSYTNREIGTELVAVDGPNAYGEYHYIDAPLRCDGSGNIVVSSTGGGLRDIGWSHPNTQLVGFQTMYGSSAQLRIFVSGCGTHFLVVSKYYPYVIDGISMAPYPVSTSAYTDVFSKPALLQMGSNISVRKDPITESCVLLPDSGLNAGMCIPGVDNGIGSASDNGTNPINPAWRGNKIKAQTDYRGAGEHPLMFTRIYNSRATRVAGLTSGFDSAITGKWTHTYQRSLQLFTPPGTSGLNTVQSVAIRRPDGKIAVFKPSGSNWVAATTDSVEALTRMGDGTWRLVTAQDETETYDTAGRLVAIANRAGLAQTLTYDGSNRLSQVSDPFGRSLTFAYDANNRLATLTDPAGNLIQYSYDGQGNLASVSYPGSQTRSYHYENAAFPTALTGITDENGQRTATYAYDSQGRATTSEHGATNSGIDKHTVNYNANGSATITDAIGAARTAIYQNQSGTFKQATSSQPGGAGCGAASSATTYDANGFVASRTDFNGNITTYTHNARGLETLRVEASGKTEARTVTTEWHATLRLPLRIAEPKKRTTYTYDPAGNLLTRSEQATTDTNGSQGFAAAPSGAARTWTFTYNTRGQVLTADGPRTDVADVTTYTYHPTDDPSPGKRGNLATVTNALGHVTQVTAYDAAGRPLTIIDPNGVTTTLTYTPRGWLKTRGIGGQTTTWDYDPAGQLTRITLGDGSFTNYHYDPAHRLTSMTDTLGRALDTTRDAAGNVTHAAWQNADASTAKVESTQYDALGRPQTRTDGRGQSTAQTFDANGNLTGITDPKTQSTTQTWDAHNRLTRISDPLNGQTLLTWDGQGQLASLTAPNGAVTTHTHDGLGNRSQEISTAAGTTTATHDEAGNLKTRSDARSIVATLTWDALNRPLTLSYPTAGENITYTWDSGTGCSHGIGRLCQVTDNLGSTRYAYDARGNRISETRLIGSLSLTTQTSYDGADRPIAHTLPGGKHISLTRNSDGQIESLAAPVAGTPVTLAQAIQTNALGETTGQTYGNGVSETRAYDSAGDLSTSSASNTGDGGSNRSGEEDVPTLPEWGALLLGSL